VDKPEKQEEADAAAETFSAAVAAKHGVIPEGLPLDEYAKAIMQGIQEAAIETGAAVWETMQYPKRVATTVHREGWGHKLDTWKSKLWAAIRSLEKGENNGKLLRGAEWPYGGKKEAPVGLVIDTLCRLDIGMRKKSAAERVEVKERIRDLVWEVDRHDRGSKKAAKAEQIAAAIKRRNDAFDAPMGKGRGKVLASIFRIVKEFNSLQWVRKNNGELASDPDEVKDVVKKFFESWMASRVGVQER
jgi:hypothetical protein